jgi:hypothetical protein
MKAGIVHLFGQSLEGRYKELLLSAAHEPAIIYPLPLHQN